MLNAILQLISNNTSKVNGFRFIVCRNNFWKPQDNEMLKADGITQMMKRFRTIDIGGDIGYERQKHLLEYLAEHCRMLVMSCYEFFKREGVNFIVYRTGTLKNQIFLYITGIYTRGRRPTAETQNAYSIFIFDNHVYHIS